jgi:hypothetical protein
MTSIETACVLVPPNPEEVVVCVEIPRISSIHAVNEWKEKSLLIACHHKTPADAV